ncbi:hypothetical protein LCGC14_1470280 [marine sediment metagenome]|uniref:IstB-like ATP-binding domain-containing protein n=1 Tax=marine sediment metagenome TaxID=412755 RepID=A0A0F9JD69_9ZZZZ
MAKLRQLPAAEVELLRQVVSALRPLKVERSLDWRGREKWEIVPIPPPPGRTSTTRHQPKDSMSTAGGLLSIEKLRARQAQERSHLPTSVLNKMREKMDEADAAPPPCPLCAGARFVRIAVPFGHPMFGQALPCGCVEHSEVADLLRFAGLPPQYAEKMTYSSFAPLLNPEAFAAMEKWDQHESVVLNGVVGTGKTHLAVAALVHAITDRRELGAYWYVPTLLDEIRRRYNAGEGVEDAQTFIDRLASTPILLLDDLGAERATDWAVEQLTTLLDRRLRGDATTLVTTNFTGIKEASNKLSDRAGSRLGAWRWVGCIGPDMRVQRGA